MPASTDSRFVAEELCVPCPFALMRFTRLCSQRLLGRNLITLFSTVNTSSRAHARRNASHAGNARRQAPRIDQAQRAARVGMQCHARWETAVFKLFGACRPASALPLARNPATRATASRGTRASVGSWLPCSHQRVRISRRTRPTAPKVREPEDANAGACAGIRVGHDASPKAIAMAAGYSSISAA